MFLLRRGSKKVMKKLKTKTVEQKIKERKLNFRIHYAHSVDPPRVRGPPIDKHATELWFGNCDKKCR
jgi:hypothetical protein